MNRYCCPTTQSISISLSCVLLSKCIQYTHSHFADSDVLLLWVLSTFRTPHANTHLFYRLYYHIPFFHNNGASRASSTFRWFTLIKLMEWNACALADSTSIPILDCGCDYDSGFECGACAEICISCQRHTPNGSCIQRVALKSYPEMFPFMSRACFLHAHMQFLWLVSWLPFQTIEMVLLKATPLPS